MRTGYRWLRGLRPPSSLPRRGISPDGARIDFRADTPPEWSGGLCMRSLVMRTGVIAKKMGMTRLFQDDGRHVPVTVLALEICRWSPAARRAATAITRVQLGAGAAKAKNCRQAAARPFRQGRGRAQGEGRRVPRRRGRSARRRRRAHRRPFRRRPAGRRPGRHPGQGLSGAMKRWGFGGLRATHGVSVSHRSLGSTGNRQDPGKRLQEQEDGRPYGRPQPHPAESRNRPHRRRAAA